MQCNHRKFGITERIEKTLMNIEKSAWEAVRFQMQVGHLA
jgi:hypothetical protein